MFLLWFLPNTNDSVKLDNVILLLLMLLWAIVIIIIDAIHVQLLNCVI